MADTPKLDQKTDATTPSGRSVTFTLPPLPRPQFTRPAGRVRAGVLAIGFVLVAGLSGFGGAWLQDRNDSGAAIGSLSDQKKIVTNQSQLISQIAKTVGPSVVSVNVSITSSSSSSSSSAFSRYYGYDQPEQQTAEAAGTGIILSSKGIIMTNRHVVPTGTTKVSITLSDGTELKDVSVIGRTNDTDSLDVAFLKINDLEGHKLTPAVIGNSSKVQVGDDAVAIGNALGQFQNTVTSGIISGFGRSVQAGDSSDSSSASAENLDNLFQTDAAINEGNSGGPLVNLNGQVIGINTAVASDSQNIGFAIPIDDVRGLIVQVLQTGKFARPYLGVRYVSLTADIAKQFELSIDNGAFIAPASEGASSSIIADGPADKAGLKEKDIITAVDGTKIDATHSLISQLNKHKPGDSVKLAVLRDGKTLSVNVTLGTLPTQDTTTDN